MHEYVIAGYYRWFSLLGKAMGILYSGLCPYMAFAQVNPGSIGTITAPDGDYIAAFGSHESYAPQSMAIGPDGHLYIADQTVIYRIEGDGSATPIVGEPQPFGEEIDNTLIENVRALEAHIVPGAMAFDRNGQLYFVDYINGRGARIARLEGDGTIATFAGTGAFGFAGDGGDARQAAFAFRRRSVRWSSLVFDPENNLLVLDYGNERIRKIDPEGNVTTLLDTTAKDGQGVAVGDAGILLGEIALDRAGHLYFCTPTRVFRRRPDGAIERIAGSDESGFGGDGGLAIRAELDLPSGLAIGRDGLVYIGDFHNNRIRRVNQSGVIETVAGSGRSYSDFAPCTAAEKRLVTSDNPCLSALGDGNRAADATIWWPERLLFTQEDDLLVSMHIPFNFLDWGGGRFSLLRRIRLDQFPTAIEELAFSQSLLGGNVSLASVFPNPFNAEISIRFDIATGSEVGLTIYNISGQIVRRLIADAHKAPGSYTINWDGRDDEGVALASGAYLMALASGQERHTQKMVLVR